VGRASNRKKAQRQGGPNSRQARRLADTLSPPARRHLASVLETLLEEANERDEREVSARRAWCGGEPVPAEPPHWPENSLGGRFFASRYLEEARHAPPILTAQIPDAAVIAAGPARWNVGTNALIRAVAFDGLAVDHPVVSALLDVLAPTATAELAYGKAMEAWLNRPAYDWDEDEPEFPEMEGPVFLLGGALVDAVWAVVGDDPLTDVRRVLLPAVANAVDAVDAEVATDALIAAFATEYRCELPGDAELLERIGHLDGNALEKLVAAGQVRPGDILPVGLAILSALARLCRSDSASVLQSAGAP
jgi:hypothetical protein